MPKKRMNHFSTSVPLMQSSKGATYQPDLLIVVQKGSVRIAKVALNSDISKLIQKMEDLIDDLKDIKWAQNKKK